MRKPDGALPVPCVRHVFWTTKSRCFFFPCDGLLELPGSTIIWSTVNGTDVTQPALLNWNCRIFSKSLFTESVNIGWQTVYLYIYSKSITFPSFLVAEVSSHQWQCFLRRWMPCVHRRLFGKPLGKGRFPHGFFPCKLANGSMGNIWQLDESSFHMSNGKKETPWLFRLFFGDEIYYSVMWGL